MYTRCNLPENQFLETDASATETVAEKSTTDYKQREATKKPFRNEQQM